jgi:hypothetical protein
MGAAGELYVGSIMKITYNGYLPSLRCSKSFPS